MASHYLSQLASPGQNKFNHKAHLPKNQAIILRIFIIVHFVWLIINGCPMSPTIFCQTYVDGSVQNCSNSSVLVMEILQSCTCCTMSSMYSLRNSLVDRCPRPAKTASVQQNTCLWWSERPAISSVFLKIHIAQIHCSYIVQNTFQSSKQFSDLNSHGSQV